MGRQLTGTLTQAPTGWTVTVPATAGSPKRRQYTFTDRNSAERWRDAAIAALRAGRRVPDPRQFTPANVERPAPVSLRFADVAWACWQEEYRDNDLCSPGTRDRGAAHLRNWIVPYFETVGGTIAEISRDDVKRFVRVMSGREEFGTGGDEGVRPMVRRSDMLSLPEAAALTGLHRSTLLRAVRAGRLPGATRIAQGPHAGEYRVRAGDLLDAGLHIRLRHGEGSGRARAGIGAGAAARSHAREILRMLRAVFVYARGKGLATIDPTEGVKALPPAASKAFTPPRTSRPRAFSLEESARVAAELHIHHQVVFWLQRVLGLRVGEAFGVHLEDLQDEEDRGLLHIHRQGGKTFIERDPITGDDVTVREKARTKTSSGDRVVIVPRQLMEFLRVYIEAFHAHPDTGEIDPRARLVVGLRDPGTGGLNGYTTALRRAFEACGLGYQDVGFSAGSHHLRKSISTDVAFLTDVRESVRSELLGHKMRAHDGGSAVTATSYTLRAPALRSLVAAAAAIEQLIEDQLPSLLVATTRAPVLVQSHYLRAEPWLSHSQSVLDSAGLLAAPVETLSTADVAAQLGLHVRQVRGLIQRGELHATEITPRNGDSSRYQIDPAEIERFRRERTETITPLEAAAATGVHVHALYQLIRSGRLRAHRVGTSRSLLIERASLEEMADELHERAGVLQRSMSLAEAAQTMRIDYRAALRLLRDGQLEADPHGPVGARYVTRTSVAAVQARRSPSARGTRTPFITVESAMELTGLSWEGVLELSREGVEIRRSGRTVRVDPQSLGRWMAGR